MDTLADFNPSRLAQLLQRMAFVLARLRGAELTVHELAQIRSIWLKADALIEAHQVGCEKAHASGARAHLEGLPGTNGTPAGSGPESQPLSVLGAPGGPFQEAPHVATE